MIPEDWMRQVARTAPDILACCPHGQRRYGHGFWTNDHALLWPDLPKDAFAACGAGSKLAWVCPSLDLVVAQSPGIHKDHADETIRQLLGRVAGACG